MALGWPGAGWHAACSPTSSVRAASTIRTFLAFSADAFENMVVQSKKGKKHHQYLIMQLTPQQSASRLMEGKFRGLLTCHEGRY